jgi:hypothetical protein
MSEQKNTKKRRTVVHELPGGGRVIALCYYDGYTPEQYEADMAKADRELLASMTPEEREEFERFRQRRQGEDD